MLELKNITKDYEVGENTVHALKGVSIAFRESEFVAILGHSGCGKTTLLNIIGGLDRYTSGDLIINGRSTSEYNDRDWDTYRNHSVGFVFQSYNLIPHQTVLQNVELSLTLSGVDPAERRRRATEVLQKVGLGDQLDKVPNQMSGGQMQRVAIARALVNDPDILLADEPTGALDSETSVQIMEILKEISKDRLIIMVTHNPELAELYATRTVKLMDGLIIGDTDPVAAIEEQPVRGETQRRPSMSFRTALRLSLTNLMTKKGRTLLTAFAGSIGIIGIALILSLSHGIQHYIDQVQEDTLTAYPLTIDAEAVDLGAMLTTIADAGENAANPAHGDDRVYSQEVMTELMSNLATMDTQVNNLAAFKTYLEDPESEINEYISTVQYNYNMGFAVYTRDPDGIVVKSDSAEMLESMMESMYGGDYTSYFSNMSAFFSSFSVWTKLLQGDDLLVSDQTKGRFDLLYGKWPEAYNEIVLIVDENNEISDLTLYALGLKSQREMAQTLMNTMSGNPDTVTQESWSYEELCALDFKLILPSEGYRWDDNAGWVDLRETEQGLSTLYADEAVGVPLKIVGVIRSNDANGMNSNNTSALGFTAALTDYAIDRVNQQWIVTQQLEHPDIDVFTGLPFPTDASETGVDKISAAKNYVYTLSGDALRSVMVAAVTTPAEATITEGVNAAMENVTRDTVKQWALENSETGDAERVNAMIDAMDDATLMNYARNTVRQIVEQQYREQMGAMYAGFSGEYILNNMTVFDYQWEYIYDTYLTGAESDTAVSYDINLKKLGYVRRESPSQINIYVSAFADKDKVAEYIDDYNQSVAEDDEISYTDYIALLMSSITKIINAISYVLIAFVAISLVVSSIMIGIITYISVLERTKEIGILRAMGASKQDISHVFNAETLIEGFAAGAIGVLVALLLLIPINLIVRHLTHIDNLRAILPFFGGVALIIISMILTFIAGLIPSRYAANKDPVVALRTE